MYFQEWLINSYLVNLFPKDGVSKQERETVEKGPSASNLAYFSGNSFN